MKQIVSNYSYSPATNVVTLTGVNIDADQLLLIVAPQVGRTMYNFASVTGTVSAGADTRVTLNASTAGLTTTSPLVIFYDDQASTQTIAGTVTANAGGDFANSIESVFDVGNVSKKIAVQLYDDNGGAVGVPNNPLPISGTVTVGGFSSVSVGSGAILIAGDRGGAITPIPIDSGSGQVGVQLKQSSGPSIDPISQTNGLWVRQANGSSITVGNSVTIGSLPAISGTVTANLFGEAVGGGPNEPTKLQCDSNGFLITSLYRSGSDAVNYDPVAGNVSVNVKNVSSVTIGSVPNGSLTTRFGTPTTANVSFATSAVTNANRKYLLIQNVTTGSNVITVGIGFTPTTTQGIQLTAGAGITFESSYIPTGQVFVLSSVTASNFTILEA
jgi:hypothetical protein